jgi:hypothetical protein
MEIPPSLASLQSGIPKELSRLVDRCISKKIPDRFQSMAELGQALRNVDELANVTAIESTFDEPHRPRRRGCGRTISAGVESGQGTTASKVRPTSQSTLSSVPLPLVHQALRLSFPTEARWM